MGSSGYNLKYAGISPHIPRFKTCGGCWDVLNVKPGLGSAICDIVPGAGNRPGVFHLIKDEFKLPDQGIHVLLGILRRRKRQGTP